MVLLFVFCNNVYKVEEKEENEEEDWGAKNIRAFYDWFFHVLYFLQHIVVFFLFLHRLVYYPTISFLSSVILLYYKRRNDTEKSWEIETEKNGELKLMFFISII